METVDQLRHHLRNSGYSQFLMCDEPTCVAVYDLQLEKNGSAWRVCETERGQVIAKYAETSEEGVATRIFLEMVSSRIYHLRTYRDAGSVAKMEFALQAANIPFERNDVPYEGKLRVFVTGSDLLKAQKVAATAET